MTARTDDRPERLVQAQEAANTAILEAEELEAQARRARRRASARLRHYETLLREYQGEQPLPLYERGQA